MAAVHQENEEFTFTLTFKQADMIVKCLGDAPYKDVYEIIAVMRKQYEAHLAFVREPLPLPERRAVHKENVEHSLENAKEVANRLAQQHLTKNPNAKPLVSQ